MRIFIIGFMGSGKSTLGRPLASGLGYDFVDLDRFIEQEEGMSVQDIFALRGENEFRTVENCYLRMLIRRDNVVISTGGGTPCFYDNMALMNTSGKTIYLKQEPELLASRLMNARVKRPLIEGKNREELLLFINEKLAEREVYYNRSSIVVANPDRNATRIINAIKFEQ